MESSSKEVFHPKHTNIKVFICHLFIVNDRRSYVYLWHTSIQWTKYGSHKIGCNYHTGFEYSMQASIQCFKFDILIMKHRSNMIKELGLAFSRGRFYLTSQSLQSASFSRSSLYCLLPNSSSCPSLDLQTSNLWILLTISTHSIKTNVRIKLQIRKSTGFGLKA